MGEAWAERLTAVKFAAWLLLFFLVGACRRGEAPSASTTTFQVVELKPAFKVVEDPNNADLGVVIHADSLCGNEGVRSTIFLKKMPEPNEGYIADGFSCMVACGKDGGRYASWMVTGGPSKGGIEVDLSVKWTSLIGGYAGQASGKMFVPWMGAAEAEFDPEFIVSARFVTPPKWDD